MAELAVRRRLLADGLELQKAAHAGDLTMVPAVVERLAHLGEPGPDEATTWRPVDLDEALAGGDLAQPELLTRTDGVSLIYRGRIHWFQGESESCKSWLALVAARQSLDAGGRVLWIDYENEALGVVSRLKALGTAPDAIRAQFTYVRPDEPLRGRNGPTPAAADLKALLAGRYDLAVIDGITEAFTLEELKILDNSDIAVWLRLLPRPLADATGAAVICIDHLTKDRDGQGRYALGGQHKLAGLTRAAYKLEVRRRFRRAGADPVDGVVAVTTTKDRVGWVRASWRVPSLPRTWPSAGVSPSTSTSTTGPPAGASRRTSRPTPQRSARRCCGWPRNPAAGSGWRRRATPTTTT